MAQTAPLPGPWTPGLYNMLRFGFTPTSFARENVQKFGLTWRLKGTPATTVFTADPENVRRIFAADPSVFMPFAPDTLLNVFGPRSVIMVGGTPHRRLRKLMMPPLHGARLRSYGESMAQLAARQIGALQPADKLRVHDLTTRYTMSVILRTVFGVEDAAETGELREILERMVSGISAVTIFLPALQTPRFPPWARHLDTQRRFDAWLTRTIAARRHRATDGDDVLSLLMATRDEDGAPRDDDEIRDQLLTLLLAGHETTAISLATAVQRLLHAPAVLSRLRDELGPGVTDPEEARAHPYLSAVLDETLRIDPIVTDVLRVVREPFELSPGVVLQPGEQVSALIEALHRLPSIYPEPERFRPERFLERKFAPYEFVPFGGGARRCLGAAFSDYESRIFLAEFVRRVRVEAVHPEPDARVRRNITMGPKRGVPIRVRSVHPS